jgi:hypothetical protein
VTGRDAVLERITQTAMPRERSSIGVTLTSRKRAAWSNVEMLTRRDVTS